MSKEMQIFLLLALFVAAYISPWGYPWHLPLVVLSGIFLGCLIGVCERTAP